MNRVAVVGVGLVSSLGNDWKSVAESPLERDKWDYRRG